MMDFFHVLGLLNVMELDFVEKKYIIEIIPLGGERVPLCSSIIGEVDDNKIKLIIVECSDLLLRGCTRGSPTFYVGLFFCPEEKCL